VHAEYQLATLLDDLGLREGARPLLEKVLSVWTGEGGGLAADVRRRLSKYR
jgi:hypothetical protein